MLNELPAITPPSMKIWGIWLLHSLPFLTDITYPPSVNFASHLLPPFWGLLWTYKSPICNPRLHRSLTFTINSNSPLLQHDGNWAVTHRCSTSESTCTSAQHTLLSSQLSPTTPPISTQCLFCLWASLTSPVSHHVKGFMSFRMQPRPLGTFSHSQTQIKSAIWPLHSHLL